MNMLGGERIEGVIEEEGKKKERILHMTDDDMIYSVPLFYR